MADNHFKFTEKSLAFMIACTVLNKYDFYVILDGLRGTGKSSCAYRLAKEMSKIFRKLYKGDMDTIFSIYKVLKKKRKDLTLNDFILNIMKLKTTKAYIFEPEKDLIYDQQSAKEFLQGWYGIGVFDEFINIGYSRDFFDRGQKDLIKLINLNRDHSHVIFACVPHFSTIDNQLRNLSKMRIYIKERGLGIIMQPNKGLTLRDKWDMDANEKIERKWLERNIRNPKWSKLTTYRGVLKTKPLKIDDEIRYQQIKTEKRASIVEAQMNVKDPKQKQQEQYDNITNDIRSFKIKGFSELDGMAKGMGITTNTLRENIRKRLREDGESTDLRDYFYDKKKASALKKRQKIEALTKDDKLPSSFTTY